MGYWCWERKDWGKWNVATLTSSDSYLSAVKALERVRYIASKISNEELLQVESRLLEEESIKTSLIEGNVLERDSVRASIHKKMGIESLRDKDTRNVDGLVETLFDATDNYNEPLTKERLIRWQASLFPTGRDEKGFPVEVGSYRTDPETMKVVTISGNKETLHYIAPPTDSVESEMANFISWFNKTSNSPNLLRAALAKYWFVSVHPFEDGNGRISRAISDMAVAQVENLPYRLFSMSETLKSKGDLMRGYYKNLEECSRGESPIESWVLFFLDTLTESVQRSEKILENILAKTAFWDNCKRISVNERQTKFLNWALDEGQSLEGNLTRKRYKKYVGRVSDVTAKRDLQDLVEKGIITPIDTVGRNAGYEITKDLISVKHRDMSKRNKLSSHSRDDYPEPK